MKFKIKIEEDEDGWYVATVPALPGCISQGKTEEEVKKNIAEAIELHLSALAEDGV
ncbi:MAG: type II toxin-antitoxin system HicB family antitoxin, partial [Euryarchaeota archaeon]|nr:type II toxin-antitoxin system HicB family antitoxin [Euryarchaeota archaeon]